MHLAPTLRLFAHVLSASLILTGLVLPATALTAAAATCGTTNIALHKPPRHRRENAGSRPRTRSTGTWARAGPARSPTRSGWRWTWGRPSASARWSIYWEAAYAKAFQIQTSRQRLDDDLLTTPDRRHPDAEHTGSGRYIRMYGTARAPSTVLSVSSRSAPGPATRHVTTRHPDLDRGTAATCRSRRDSASADADLLATGLPPGCPSATGLISGTPTAAGTSVT